MKNALVVFLIVIASCTHSIKPEQGEMEIEYIVDGLKIKGMLFMPNPINPSVKYPAVIVNHGGTSGINEDIIALCRVLRDNGYIVAASHYRGEGGSEGSTEGFFDRARIRDSLGLLDVLDGLGIVDTENIFMVGHSIGGFVTYGASIETDRIRAYVAISGVFMPFLCKLEHVKGPILIIHGKEDRRVYYFDSECASERLSLLGEEHELILYEGAGHHVFSRGMRDKIYSDILSWLERHKAPNKVSSP